MTARLLRLFVISLITYGLMRLVHYVYFWDVRPIAFAPETQSTWRLEAAFALTSVEYVSIAVVAISAFFLLTLVYQQIKGRAH